MPALDILIYLSIAALLTSFLAGVIGQGGGMILMTVLAPFIPSSVLIPFHGSVQLASNASRAFFNRNLIQWTLIIPIGVGMLIGGLFAIPIIGLFNGAPLIILAGCFILYSTWRPIKLLAKPKNASLSLLGLIQGHLGIIVGATGPLGNALLKNLKLNVHQVIATNALIMSLSHILKLLAFAFIGVSLWAYWPLLLMMAIASIIGSKLGTLLKNRLPLTPLTFAFKCTLTLLSLNMIRLGILGLI